MKKKKYKKKMRGGSIHKKQDRQKAGRNVVWSETYSSTPPYACQLQKMLL